MNYLDKGTLIMIPSAYGEGKLACVKPTDGSGDFTFNRASSAIRTNASGILELACYNLLSYSEQFDNSSWIKQDSTILQNAAMNPYGDLSADLLYPNSSGNFKGLRQSNTTLIGELNASVFLKAQNKSRAFLRFDNATYALFDLQNGTVVNYNTIEIPEIESAGNGWYRCSVNYNALTTTLSSFYLSVVDVNYPSVTANGTDGIYIWGAQTTQGFGVKPYLKTTDRLNIPRLDYSGGATCPSILVEPQRTNLLINSEDAINWLASNVTVNPNDSTSPKGNGDITADLLTSTNNSSFISNSYSSGSSNTTYTTSVYMKNNNSTTSQFIIANTITAVRAQINWSGSDIVSITNITGTTIFEYLQDGWYRIISSYTSVEPIQRLRIYPDILSGVNSIYAWGSQIEVGSYATSYIPTTTTTVTRLPDNISKTGISSLIGQTEGTIFLHSKNIEVGSLGGLVNITNLASNRILLYTANAVTPFVIQVRINGVDNIATVSSVNLKNENKIAFAYKNGDSALYINGVKINTPLDTINYNFPVALDKVNLMNYDGANFTKGDIKMFYHSKERLTNAELQKLTTL